MGHMKRKMSAIVVLVSLNFKEHPKRMNRILRVKHIQKVATRPSYISPECCRFYSTVAQLALANFRSTKYIGYADYASDAVWFVLGNILVQVNATTLESS